MAENSEKRWLPADTILGAEASAATDIALAPLAILARRIRRATAWGVTAMLAAGSVLAIAASVGAGGWLSALGAVLCISLALGLTAQRLGLAAGDSRWWRLYAVVPIEAKLPMEAQRLLEDVRDGRRSVRYHRGQAGKAHDLSWGLARGKFGPLILASNPADQALMLRDWYGGDGLAIEFENFDNEQEKIQAINENYSYCSVNSAPPRHQFNHFLYYDAATFDLILRNAYPEYFVTREGANVPHRIKLIVRCLQIARDLLEKGDFVGIADFRDAVLRRLEGDDDATLEHHGLRESSDAVSSSWLEKALHSSGYPNIKKRLLLAEERVMLTKRPT